MKRTCRTRLATSALVLMLGSGAAFAQETQLNDSAMAGIAQLGIDLPAGTTVSDDQAVQIESVINGTDDRDAQIARIEDILGLDVAATTGAGSEMPQLQDSVRAEMAALGVDTSAVGVLSVEQLGQIENITSSTDDDVLKKQRIEQVLADAGFTPVTTTENDPTNGLGGLVGADLARLGMTDVDVSTLPLEKLTLIRGVTSSSDDAVQQRARVERILAE